MYHRFFDKNGKIGESGRRGTDGDAVDKDQSGMVERRNQL